MSRQGLSQLSHKVLVLDADLTLTELPPPGSRAQPKRELGLDS